MYVACSNRIVPGNANRPTPVGGERLGSVLLPACSFFLLSMIFSSEVIVASTSLPAASLLPLNDVKLGSGQTVKL